MNNYKIKIEIEKADNGFFMYANIHGNITREIYTTKEDLYDKLNSFKEAVNKLESNGN